MTQPLAFKARKVLRYVRVYGPRRTLVKVESTYHMRRRYKRLPPIGERPIDGRHVGVIGCGNFAYTHVAYYLDRSFGKVIRGCMDVDINRAASLFQKYGATYYTDDPAAVVEDPAIDLVYIASNHASHAEYAIAALEQGKHVHIEKPHVVREEQLERLCRAMESSPGQVALGFNRPLSPIGREVERALGRQEGPAMMSWFIAGHAMPPDHWYYAEEEGGRVLGNLCHWTDFVLRMLPREHRFPIEINPTPGRGRHDTDIAVTYTFGDGSIAVITFSSKGHAFEGVKERFAAHRGDALLAMDDFQTLTVQVGHDKTRTRLPFRDHGHRERIRASYRMARPGNGAAPSGEDPAHVLETGKLFLMTKQALESGETLRLEPSAAIRAEGRSA